MHILVISEGVPSRIGGGRSRQFNLIKELAGRHRFTVVTYSSGPKEDPAVQELRGLCEEVIVFRQPDPPLIRSLAYYRFNGWKHTLFETRPRRGEWLLTAEAKHAVARLTKNQHFDLLQVHQGYMARLLPPRVRCATLLDMHDVLSDYEKLVYNSATGYSHRLANYAEWQKMRRFERAIIERFDACAVVSEEDRRSVCQLVPHVNPIVVPNGVDTTYFQPQKCKVADDLLLFVGSMNYAPNEQGILHFCRSVWPQVKSSIPEARLRIVGIGPSEHIRALQGTNSIDVTGEVPDVRPHLAEAAAVISPIYIASGTRLKILDAWAMRKAVVSTSVGAQGLKANHMENAWIADSDPDLAQGVIQLFRDTVLRERLASAGLATAVQRYSWTPIAGLMQTAYERALAKHPHSALAGADS